MRKPRAPRKITSIKAQMNQGSRWVKVGIGNVSSTGLMVKHQPPPSVGSSVELVRRGVRITGQVVWASGSRFGVHAAEPIDVDAVLADSELNPKSIRPAPAPSRIWHWRVPRN